EESFKQPSEVDGRPLLPFKVTTYSRKMGARSASTDVALVMTVAAILFGVCGFIAVAWAVNAGMTRNFDERLLRAPRDPADPAKTLGPVWLEEVGRDLTALGGIAYLSLTTAVVSGYLLICHKYRALALLLAATLGGLLLSTVLK